MKTYNELQLYKTFKQRFDYLKLNSSVGHDTFGFDRYVNQTFYKSKEWRKVRREVIIRDNGCDLGIAGCEIPGQIIIHHINPITLEDLINRDPKILDMDNLICVSHETHEAIHYGYYDTLPTYNFIERKPGDTCLWKNQF